MTVKGYFYLHTLISSVVNNPMLATVSCDVRTCFRAGVLSLAVHKNRLGHGYAWLYVRMYVNSKHGTTAIATANGLQLLWFVFTQARTQNIDFIHKLLCYALFANPQ